MTSSRDFLPFGPCGDDQVLHLRGGASDVHDFVCFVKNARSVQTETRFKEMLYELEGMPWDVVLLSETWRREREKKS